MGRKYFRGGGWFLVYCLLGIAGCVPVRQGAKGLEGSRDSSSSTMAGAKDAAGAAAQTQALARQTTESPSPTSPTEPGIYRMGSGDPVLVERVDFYREKKLEWDETARRVAGLGAEKALPESWPGCARAIELALAGYQQLQAGLEQDLNPWQTVKSDLDYFAKGCDQVFARVQTPAKTAQEGGAAMGPDRAAESLRQFFEARQYQEAVTAYEALLKPQEGAVVPAPPAEGGLPASDGQGVQVSREAKTYYSRALVKLGRLHEAAVALTELLQDAGPVAELAELEVRVLTGDVLLADGQVDEARQVYEGVAKALLPVVEQQAWAAAHAQAFSEPARAEDLGLYRELIQAYLSFDGRRLPPVLVDGVSRLQAQTTGPLVDLARMVQTKAMVQSQSWARTQLAEARALIEAHDLARARALLEGLATAAPEEMKPAIAQLQAATAQDEQAVQQDSQATPGQGAVSPWATALQLFEQQRYDEAIAEFQKLLTGEHGAEAQAKMAEATELAAAGMRRQAAALYAKARKTFDPEAKRQALLGSRTLLLELIEKYPQASVIAKARQNLKVIDTELGQPADLAAPLAPVSSPPEAIPSP